MAMWHYSCTMVTRLLICVAKSGGQGLDSDRTLLFLTNLPTILMLAPTWELSAPWSHDSHVFCIRRAFWTWEQWEQCKLLWSYVNYVKLKSFLKSFVFFRAFLQGWNPAKGLPGGGILECAFCGPLGTLKRNHHSIALVALSNLFTSHILNVTLPWTICIDMYWYLRDIWTPGAREHGGSLQSLFWMRGIRKEDAQQWQRSNLRNAILAHWIIFELWTSVVFLELQVVLQFVVIFLIVVFVCHCFHLWLEGKRVGALVGGKSCIYTFDFDLKKLMVSWRFVGICVLGIFILPL